MKNGHIQWEMYATIPYMDPMGLNLDRQKVARQYLSTATSEVNSFVQHLDETTNPLILNCFLCETTWAKIPVPLVFPKVSMSCFIQ